MRILALALSLVFTVQLIPATALASDSGIGTETETNTSPYEWQKTNTEDQRVSTGKAAENTYIFEVSSGTRQGGEAADNILYFVLEYTTARAKRSVVLMPGIDAVSESLDIASAAGNRYARENSVFTCFGYSTDDYRDRVGLGSLATDQMMFTTPEPIVTVDKIQIFGKKTDEGSDWSCQGMRVFKVNTLYGVDMYGWYSNEYFIDFDGEVIADAVMAPGSGFFRWNNTGGTFNIVGDSVPNGTAGCTLINTATNSTIRESYETRYNTKSFVGSGHTTQADHKTFLRLDFADTGGAGFETLAASYELGSKTPISRMGLCECAVLIVRYEDIYGCIREAELPLIVNSLGWAMETLGNVALAGYAQQGDSIAVCAVLPDYKSFSSASITMGHEGVLAVTGLEYSAVNAQALARTKASEADDINYTCFAVYEDVDVDVALDGATLRTRFRAGDNNPVAFASSSSVNGIVVHSRDNVDKQTAQQTQINRTYFTTQEYSPYMQLLPQDNTEKYLITLYTDNVETAGTTADLYLQFHYISLKDKELVSQAYNVRELVRQFYGEWPGNVSEFAYTYGMSQGGKIQFMISLSGVKLFTNVSVKIDGQDEWQMRGLSIAAVNSYDSRSAAWSEIASSEKDPADPTTSRYKSHLVLSRNVNVKRVEYTIGKPYEPAPTEPKPGEDNWEAGTLIQDDGNYKTLDVNGTVIDEKEDIDWSRISRYMQYDDAIQDLGFAKKRCNYVVTLTVGGDKTTANDDDCGSKNLFYFQLVFESGSSGCILANQQILGDAFRTGAEVTFNIPTTQDYGDLVAINVIPDDQDGNSDIYDKLNIKSIKVVRDTDDAISPTWYFENNDKDGLGWVGIEYRDPGEAAAQKRSEGRTLSEIATTYNVTSSSYSAKFLVSITTGTYAKSVTGKFDIEGRPITVQDVVLEGGMTMSYNYFDSEGRLRSQEPMDIIELMNEYSGRKGTTTRTVPSDVGDIIEEMDYYVSDPQYQFRPGKTDSFWIDIDDIYQLVDMKLQIKSSVVTKWNITDVSVYLIRGKGTRYINGNGEYDYRYNAGETPLLVTQWTRESLTKDVEVYRKLQGTGIGEINIQFGTNPISINEKTGSWTAEVTREPKSNKDTFNLVIYPTIDNKYADPSSYTLVSAVRYTDTLNKRPMQVSTGNMKLGKDQDGRTRFYAMGRTASNRDDLSGVDVKSSSRQTITAPMSVGYLQRVRNGVLIETYYLLGIANAEIGGTMTIYTNENRSTQRVIFQASPDTAEQTLSPEANDLAVAIYFRTNGPTGVELRSKYVYLTDQGYTKVKPGEMFELDYNLGDVTEVAGVSFVSVGQLDMKIENVLVADQTGDDLIEQKWYYQGTIIPKTTPARYAMDTGHTGLFRLDLETAADEPSLNSGTDTPIRMTISYYDRRGTTLTKTYSDITPYIQTGEGFEAGGTDNIRILVPDFQEIRWVSLEPWDDNADNIASWKLAKLTAASDLTGKGITKVLDQRINEYSPARVVLTDIMLIGNPSKGDQVATGETKSVTIESGETYYMSVKVYGSTDGYKAELFTIDPSTGSEVEADLTATHGYDDDYLQDLYDQASEAAKSSIATDVEKSAANQVADLVKSMQESAGSFEPGYSKYTISFKAPSNFTNSTKQYRLKVSSTENPEAYFTVDITVKTEADKLPSALAAWGGDQIAVTANINDPTGKATETFNVNKGEKLSKMIESSGSILIRSQFSSISMEAKLYSLDPVSDATGTASTGTIYGYSDDQVAAYKELASEKMISQLPELASSATKLYKLIDEAQKEENAGSFTAEATKIEFETPINYSDSNAYYRIIVTDAGTGRELFTLDITVKADNTLREAVEAFNQARGAEEEPAPEEQPEVPEGDN